MPLFKCEDCGCVENTALCSYWSRHSDSIPESHRGRALCSACSSPTFTSGAPNRKGGKWHGQFARTSAAAAFVDTDGFLWKQGQKDAGLVPKSVVFIGYRDGFNNFIKVEEGEKMPNLSNFWEILPIATKEETQAFYDNHRLSMRFFTNGEVLFFTEKDPQIDIGPFIDVIFNKRLPYDEFVENLPYAGKVIYSAKELEEYMTKR